MSSVSLRQLSVDVLTLFSSTGTLLCCALPATLVALGAGGVMASLVSTVPAVIIVSQHKTELFVFSALMLTLGGIMQYRARTLPCPIDEDAMKSCMRTRRLSLITYYLSLSIYLVGAFFAYLAPVLL